MKRLYGILAATLLLVGATGLLVPASALASGTASGTSIANKATVNYDVNSVAQSPIESSPTGNSTSGAGNGTNTTFVVDNKVDVSIAADTAGYVTILPGGQAALKFTVTNNGNTTQDYVLSTLADAGNTISGATVDLYNDTGCTVSGTWDSGCTKITSTPRITSLAEDGSAIIYIVITAPNGATDGQVANYALKAVTYDASGGGLTAQTAGANTAGVDVVFADGDGDGAGTDDTSHDGLYVKWDTAPSGSPPSAGYKVSSAKLTVTKTSTVYSDPIDSTTNPKAIPGAVVTYTVTVANNGTANATGVSIVDDLNTEIATNGHIAFNTQYNDGTASCSAGDGITVDTGSGETCKTNLYSSNDDGASWNDTGDPAGGTNTVAVSGLTISAGSTVTIRYQVTIQ